MANSQEIGSNDSINQLLIDHKDALKKINPIIKEGRAINKKKMQAVNGLNQRFYVSNEDMNRLLPKCKKFDLFRRDTTIDPALITEGLSVAHSSIR